MISSPPIKVDCRKCGKEIWLHTAKSGKKYPGNSETDRRDFHNCGEAKPKKKGTKFGNEAKTRQLDLDLPQETATETGSRIIAFIAFPKDASIADVKAILARIGDDAQKISITRTVE